MYIIYTHRYNRFRETLVRGEAVLGDGQKETGV